MHCHATSGRNLRWAASRFGGPRSLPPRRADFLRRLGHPLPTHSRVCWQPLPQPRLPSRWPAPAIYAHARPEERASGAHAHAIWCTIAAVRPPPLVRTPPHICRVSASLRHVADWSTRVLRLSCTVDSRLLAARDLPHLAIRRRRSSSTVMLPVTCSRSRRASAFWRVSSSSSLCSSARFD